MHVRTVTVIEYHTEHIAARSQANRMQPLYVEIIRMHGKLWGRKPLRLARIIVITANRPRPPICRFQNTQVEMFRFYHFYHW